MPYQAASQEGFIDVSTEMEEFERQSRIAARSKLIADVAQQLLKVDAGAGCIQAALVCWDKQYGKEAAAILARTALTGVCDELNPSAGSPG